MFYGDMKTHILTIISLCLFTIFSWSYFIFTFVILSDSNSKFEDSLDNIESKIDYLNDTVSFLSDEKVFEKEMVENLSYYLPEGFSSRVRYIRSTPLDLEAGEARVYFVHRHKNYKVDFTYSYNGKTLNIDRKSAVDLL